MKSKKNTTKIFKKYLTKTKKGGAQQYIKNKSQEIMGETFGGEDKVCNMERDMTYKDRVKTSQNFGYTKKRFTKKLNNHALLKEKNKIFVEDYLKPAFKNFCIEMDTQKYLKFCTNILKCIVDGETLIETFFKLYNINNAQKENIYGVDKYKKRIEAIPENGEIDAEKEQIIKEAKKEYIDTFSKFVVQVLIKSIEKYESKYHGRAIGLTIAKSLYEIFIGIDIAGFKGLTEINSITTIIGVDETKLREALSKEGAADKVEKLFNGDIEKVKNTSSNGISIDDPDKIKSPFYTFWLVGGIALSTLLYMDLLDSPPGVEIPTGFM